MLWYFSYLCKMLLYKCVYMSHPLLRRIKSVVAIVSMLCVITGCTSRDILHNIDKAQTVASDRPEEALAIMQGIPKGGVHGIANQARYALAYSEALYYNFIDVDSDTLTRSMAEYYIESDCHDERAEALYYHALVMRKRGELAEAMLMLEEAEVSLASVSNPKLLALVHRTKGDIYNDGCLFVNALNSYAEAYNLFEALGLEKHSCSLLYDMGATEIQIRDFEGAERDLSAALEYGIHNGDRRFVCAVLHELLDLSIYNDDYQLCGELLDKFYECDALLFGQAHYYAIKAIHISHLGHIQEALAMLDDAESMEGVEWADINYARYMVYRNGGDSANALRWHEMGKHLQDALMLEVLEQPVLNVQIDKLRYSLQSERRERELVTQRNILIFVAVAIVAVVMIVVVVRRMRRKNEEIEHYVATVGELRDTLKMLPREMSATVGALYRDRFSDLNELCETYYDHEGSTRSKSMIYNKFISILESMKCDKQRLGELEDAVNRYRGGVMALLRREMPRLNERDMRVALYTFAGFSNRAIAIFIDSDPVAVSKMRYNIKHKIKNANIADGETLIAALSEK